MDHTTILTNVERLLKERKTSADALSKKAGRGDAIRNLRRRVRGQTDTSWTVDTLTDIAHALGTEAWCLLKPGRAADQPLGPEALKEIEEMIEKSIRQKDRISGQTRRRIK